MCREGIWEDGRFSVDGIATVLKSAQLGEWTGNRLQCGSPAEVDFSIAASTLKWRRPLVWSPLTGINAVESHSL